MKTVTLFRWLSATADAGQVAERFAASYWAERRGVGHCRIPDDRPDCLDFQVTGGHGTWYRAEVTGHEYNMPIWAVGMLLPADTL